MPPLFSIDLAFPVVPGRSETIGFTRPRREGGGGVLFFCLPLWCVVLCVFLCVFVCLVPWASSHGTPPTVVVLVCLCLSLSSPHPAG